MKKKWLATLLIGVSIISVGCQKEEIESEGEVETQTENPLDTEQNKDVKEGKLTRDNSSAKETKINAGTFEVGKDVSVGRYVLTGNGDGNFSIYDGEVQIVHEILDATNEIGVASVTLDLYEGQKIEVSGLNELILTPAKTPLLRLNLSTGNWTVGIDIEPGRYIVEPILLGYLIGKGSLLVYDGEKQVVNEFLDANGVLDVKDASGEIGVKLAVIELKEDQTIRITGIPEVKFTKE
ncbi:hypothetical protein [Solibacillus sp. FSL K6-1523]|uniref:hypothetical protein n=1 Tax=Solibacillus sp. FSL K6-1523 TaxID=2921471 RepID=UPI0030F5DEE7